VSSPAFRIEPFEQQDRTGFNCGVEPLNEYFRTRMSQDSRKRVTFCYVAIENETNGVAGYYTLAASSIKLGDLPQDITKRLPRYPTIPAVRIGRLAVDMRFRGRKLGGVLLFDAIDRTCKSGIAAYAVIVDAKDDSAVSFYEHHGFKRFNSLERTLFLPISDALRKLTQ
jgi:predicted GNAT family N-acyltransferase